MATWRELVRRKYQATRMFITCSPHSAIFAVLIPTKKNISFNLCQGIGYSHSDFLVVFVRTLTLISSRQLPSAQHTIHNSLITTFYPRFLAYLNSPLAVNAHTDHLMWFNLLLYCIKSTSHISAIMSLSLCKTAKSDYYLPHVCVGLSVCLSVVTSVRIQKFGSPWMNFHKS
jgi:hypothetical protein